PRRICCCSHHRLGGGRHTVVSRNGVRCDAWWLLRRKGSRQSGHRDQDRAMNHDLYRRSWRAFVLAAALGLNSACVVKRIAVNKLGASLAGSGSTSSSDDDPEFLGNSVPLSLKLIESLLAESPNHRGMLIAASSGFTQYAYAFIQQQADEAEDKDLARATALRGRARRMYLRARGYGLRALEVKHRGFE